MKSVTLCAEYISSRHSKSSSFGRAEGRDSGDLAGRPALGRRWLARPGRTPAASPAGRPPAAIRPDAPDPVERRRHWTEGTACRGRRARSCSGPPKGTTCPAGKRRHAWSSTVRRFSASTSTATPLHPLLDLHVLLRRVIEAAVARAVRQDRAAPGRARRRSCRSCRSCSGSSARRRTLARRTRTRAPAACSSPPGTRFPRR